MPVGGPNGGPLQVTLTQQQLDAMSEGLFRRCRLPLDQACWQAGVDLNQVIMDYQKAQEKMAQKGVPQWKREMVSEGRESKMGIRGCKTLSGPWVLVKEVKNTMNNIQKEKGRKTSGRRGDHR